MVNHDSAEAISQILSKFSAKVLPAIASILFFSGVEVYAYRIPSGYPDGQVAHSAIA